MRIIFVVTYDRDGIECRFPSYDYREAVEEFKKLSVFYSNVRLYRRKTIVQEDLILRA